MTKEPYAASPGVQTCRTVEDTYNPVVYILNLGTSEIVYRYTFAQMFNTREAALARAQIEMIKILGHLGEAQQFSIKALSKGDMERGGFTDATLKRLGKTSL